MAARAHDPSLRPSAVPWPPILLAGAIVAALALGHYAPLDWPGTDDMAARSVGIGLGALGLGLVIWAGLTLLRYRTAIFPHHAASHLVTAGPFAFRRNPIYLGEMLMLLGAAELTKNFWFVLITPIFAALITWLAIGPEERHLEAKFGDSGRAYAEKTRRLL